ncbi:RDD family protein [Solwaraspora sp. WMMB335]|uniref:RDD family protein n=1 Tax=Solwaraspora sp. WMMB335 TaxID=3404118 RepID=UPI003B964B55
MSGRTSGGTTLVSGEAVEVEVRLARVGSRVLALLIDLLVQGLLALFLVLLAGSTLAAVRTSVEVDEALGQALLTIGAVLVLVGYPVACETLGNGRTAGKLAVGIRVVRDDGTRLRLRHALARSLVGVAAEWPGLLMPPLTWLASLVTMLATSNGKRLGDLAAGTIVIHDRTPASWGWVPGMPPALAAWARTLDLTRLDDGLALSVRQLLARGHGFVEPARSELVRMLAAEVAQVTAPPPPAGVPGWAYLAAVLAERHRRSAQRLAGTRALTAALWPELARLTPARAVMSRATGHTPVRAAAPVQAAAPGQRSVDGPGTTGASGPEWPRESWPRPPWLASTGEQPDWTGIRRPPVASTLTGRPDRSTPADDDRPA